MNFNEDDRAQRLLDIFDLPVGQINVSYVNSTKHVVAWHKHVHQTDYWICLKGSFKVGLATKIEGTDMDILETPLGQFQVKWEYLSDKNPRVLQIDPETYHGYMALEPGSILLYYLDHKWDPTDEHRASMGAFGEDWRTENK